MMGKKKSLIVLVISVLVLLTVDVITVEETEDTYQFNYIVSFSKLVGEIPSVGANDLGNGPCDKCSVSGYSGTIKFPTTLDQGYSVRLYDADSSPSSHHGSETDPDNNAVSEADDFPTGGSISAFTTYIVKKNNMVEFMYVDGCCEHWDGVYNIKYEIDPTTGENFEFVSDVFSTTIEDGKKNLGKPNAPPDQTWTLSSSNVLVYVFFESTNTQSTSNPEDSVVACFDANQNKKCDFEEDPDTSEEICELEPNRAWVGEFGVKTSAPLMDFCDANDCSGTYTVTTPTQEGWQEITSVFDINSPQISVTEQSFREPAGGRWTRPGKLANEIILTFDSAININNFDVNNVVPYTTAQSGTGDLEFGIRVEVSEENKPYELIDERVENVDCNVNAWNLCSSLDLSFAVDKQNIKGIRITFTGKGALYPDVISTKIELTTGGVVASTTGSSTHTFEAGGLDTSTSQIICDTLRECIENQDIQDPVQISSSVSHIKLCKNTDWDGCEEVTSLDDTVYAVRDSDLTSTASIVSSQQNCCGDDLAGDCGFIIGKGMCFDIGGGFASQGFSDGGEESDYEECEGLFCPDSGTGDWSGPTSGVDPNCLQDSECVDSGDNSLPPYNTSPDSWHFEPPNTLEGIAIRPTCMGYFPILGDPEIGWISCGKNIVDQLSDGPAAPIFENVEGVVQFKDGTKTLVDSEDYAGVSVENPHQVGDYSFICYNETSDDYNIGKCCGNTIDVSCLPNKVKSHIGYPDLFGSFNVVGDGGFMVGDDVYFCTTDKEWRTDLDTDWTNCDSNLGEKRWTGATQEEGYCCGEPEDKEEYYNEKEGSELGACWDGEVVENGDSPVFSYKGENIRFNEIVVVNGSFQGCAIDEDKAWPEDIGDYDADKAEIGKPYEGGLIELDLGSNDFLLDYKDFPDSKEDVNVEAFRDDLVNDNDYCTVVDIDGDEVNDGFCSYKEVWEGGGERTHLSFIGWDDEEFQQAECCEAEQCWVGDECVDSGYRHIIGGEGGDEMYQCHKGSWAGLEDKKYDYNYEFSGYCIAEDFCYLREGDAGYNNNDVCVSDGYWEGDHYCEDGEWTSRTKLIAKTMMEIVSGDDYTLFCDNYETVLNYVDYYITDSRAEDYFTGEFSGDRICEEEGCINNVCVLRLGTDLGDDEVFLGFSLNPKGESYEGELDVLDMFGGSDFENTCRDALEDDGYNSCYFEPEHGDYMVFVNNNTQSIIYTSQTPGSVFTSTFRQIFLDPITSIVSQLTGQISIKKFVTEETKDFRKVYVDKKGTKYVRGVIEKIEGRANSRFMAVTYSGFDDAQLICDSINEFEDICTVDGSDAKVFTSESSDFQYWVDMTAKLRVK